MYNINTHDEHEHTLATATTLDAAIAAVEDVTSLTSQQLANNGEGSSEFWLCLIVREIMSGEAVYYQSSTCAP